MELRRINLTKIKNVYTHGLVQLCVLFSQSQSRIDGWYISNIDSLRHLES